jgi:hypothetical protein
MNIIKTIAVGLVLTGCASHPKMTTFTPASVVVDYSGNDLYEATRLAQQYCQSVGRGSICPQKMVVFGAQQKKLSLIKNYYLLGQWKQQWRFILSTDAYA